MKLTRRQLRLLIIEAIDTKLSRARSKGSLGDARPDEKRAARRAERSFGRQQARRAQHGQEFDYSLEDITSQDMADAKRHAGEDPSAQANYLGISVDEWHNVRQEMDEWYEERHFLDQEESLPDADGDGRSDDEELMGIARSIQGQQ